MHPSGRILLVFVIMSPMATIAAAPVDFQRDILPILSDNCFACHGPDEGSRKAKLRLDTRDGAMLLRDGDAAIVPGKPEASTLVHRIAPEDADDIMPPAKTGRKLTPAQIALLRDWVKQGAEYPTHWAFVPPRRPSLPKLSEAYQKRLPKDSKSVRNPIDLFVLARLEKEKLLPSPQADEATLLRRVSYDLTGLPPTVSDTSKAEADAYSESVERLLASPHFGERMTMWWLDAARYADTDGYQQDETRSNWPWRDWVIDSFNRDMPFDQFTTQQFAGDLMEEITRESSIDSRARWIAQSRDELTLATAFHRHHMTNGEGGRDAEESRIDYVIDRVNTTGTVWLGLTLGCTQCHSHKFDPVSHADYYSFNAFFNSIDEDGKAGRGARPYLAYQSPYVARALTEAQSLVDARKPHEAQAKKDAEKPFAIWLDAKAQQVSKGHDAWRVLRAAVLETIEGTTLTQDNEGIVQASGEDPRQDDYRVIANINLPRITGVRLEVLPNESHTDGGLSRGKSGQFILTDIKLQVRRTDSAQVRDINVASAVADYMADPKKNDGYGNIQHVLDDDPRNGWTTNGFEGWQAHRAVFALESPLVLEEGEQLIVELRHRSTVGDANIGRFRISVTDEAGPAVRSIDATPLEELAIEFGKNTDITKLDAKLRGRLLDAFLTDYEPYLLHKRALGRANAQLAEIKKAAGKVNVMVLAERKQPRETHVLVRGVWDKKGEVVQPDVPAAIAAWPKDSPRTRLGLAQWIVSRDNPLTARVIVNQLWQICFGEGLVRTPEDFGLQGERPTHPQVLDWLAVEFIESGWDIKHILRLIVSSATYQQSSHVSAELAARDPDNRMLAHVSRFRLPSWMLRDGALHAAGLLNPAIGGPPVRPYQPEGVWEENFMGRFTYEPSEGPAQHRRTVYAFWRRASAPTFLFDAAQRRVCEVGASRTNTPLHALTLLNDESYLEASRALAMHAINNEGTFDTRLDVLFKRVLNRQPRAGEITILRRVFDQALAHYKADRADAMRMLAIGQADALVTKAAKSDAPALASWMVVASTVLNMDEALNHE